MSDEDIKRRQQYIEIWSKAVDTQMHFNDMCAKSRQLGLAFVTAALGIGVILLADKKGFSVNITIFEKPLQIHVTVILILSSTLALFAVRQLDLNVYHKMLRGAVTFGEDFEENYMKEIFQLDKGMTQSISHFSRYTDASCSKDSNGKYTYSGTDKQTALDKVKSFYFTAIVFLILSALFLFLVQNKNIFGL